MGQDTPQLCQPAATLEAEQVRAYLEAHPQFFQQQAEFLADVRLPHAQRGSVSLVDRQLEKLREHNQQLREEITELMAIAQHNEVIYRNFCSLYLALLSCNSINDVEQTLQSHLLEALGLSAMALWPLSESQDWMPRSEPLAHEALANLVTHRLSAHSFYLGRLSASEQALLFADKPAASVALMALEGDSILLAFASADDTHFSPELDLLLLTQLRALVSAVVRQLRERRNG